MVLQATERTVQDGFLDLSIGKGMLGQAPEEIVPIGLPLLFQDKKQHWFHKSIQVPHRTRARKIMPGAFVRGFFSSKNFGQVRPFYFEQLNDGMRVQNDHNRSGRSPACRSEIQKSVHPGQR